MKPGSGSTVFVFGSNREGRHGAGAALFARRKWGARYGQAEGLQGDSYAIVTKELRPHFPPVTLDEVAAGVSRFLTFAKAHPDTVFLVTAIGTGLAGFFAEEIAPMFAGSPLNVVLPQEFKRVINRTAGRTRGGRESQDHPPAH